MNKRLILIKAIGVLFLVVGLLSLFAFPAEFTSFYAFSSGGAFYYVGFGFGSILFTVILTDALLYAVLALVLIPVGIENIKSTYLGFKLSRILFMTVMVMGIAAAFCFGFSLQLRNFLNIAQSIVIILLILISLVFLPFLLLCFYNQKTERLFSPSRNTYLENQSEQKMMVFLLNMFWVAAFVVMIFLQGAFPFMGRFVFEVRGTYFLSTVIFALIVINYLFYMNIRLIKYVMLAFFAFLALSVVFTFSVIPLRDFIGMLKLPAYERLEMSNLLNMASGINLGWFFGIVLAIQTILLFTDKKQTNIS